LRIQGDQFPIENEVAPERGERLHNHREALVEHFLVARKQRDLPPMLHGNAAIAVEFDLKGPFFICGQCRNRLALHRLNERRFCALQNSRRTP
jgi:hypothetical protein